MKTKLLIFGITGDLSTRKLLPALDKIVQVEDFKDLEIIGVSRRRVDIGELLESALGSRRLQERTTVFSMDVARASDYEKLKQHIDLQEDEQLLVYLSVPPSAAARIVDLMGEAGITTPNVKILFEKPFGVDLESAVEMIERTQRYYGEDQIYRIDHYLAKEMTQNLSMFRGGNALFGHLWNNSAIERIEVLALEKLGIEGRVQFYEQTGALRDVVQGHLMQLLALALMEIPDNFDWNQLPQMRLAALRQLRPADLRSSYRAQYDGYQQEVGNVGSQTETFVSVQLASADPRWENVPLILTTGKALDKKTTELRIHFRKFHDAQSNCLILRIQPNAGVEIELFAKRPGYDRQLEPHKLHFSYPEDTELPDAYEQVLVDAIRSHKSLFTSGQEVLASWSVLEPLQNTWMMEKKPLAIYAPSSSIEAVLSHGYV